VVSKYDAIMKTLPKAEVATDEHQERINAAKARIQAGEKINVSISVFPETLESAVETIRTIVADFPAAGGTTYNKAVILANTLAIIANCGTIGPIGMTSPQLADAYAVLRRAKAELEEREKEINLWLEALNQLGCDAYETDDISSLTLGDGSSVRSQPEVYAGVEDKERFRLWCIKNGYEKELSMQWATMNMLTKKRLEAGQPEPDGVKAWVKTKFVFQKPRGKHE